MALTDNLISFWELGEASGTRNDSHGTNHLTDNNTVTQVAGKVGNAGQFTRANSEYLSIADNDSVSVATVNFTWAAWVYLDSTPAETWMYIVGKEGAVASDTDYALRYTTVGGLNRFTFFMGGDTDYSVINASTFGAPSTGTWYFVVGWHNDGDDTVNIQINNGTVDSTARTGVPLGEGGTSPLHIGSMGLSADRFWDGRIDQLAFWKRVLTASERATLFNSGNGLTYAQVVAGGANTQVQLERGIRGLNRGLMRGLR